MGGVAKSIGDGIDTTEESPSGAEGQQPGMGRKLMQGIGQGLKDGLQKRDEEQAAIRANARPVQFQIDQPQLSPDFFQSQNGYLQNGMQRFMPQNPMSKFNPFYGG